MVNYKVQPTGEWEPIPSVTQPGTMSGYVQSTFKIVETTTDLTVKTGLSRTEAKELCRHLNFGGGFDGWTPTFFLEKNKISFSNDSVLV